MYDDYLYVCWLPLCLFLHVLLHHILYPIQKLNLLNLILYYPTYTTIPLILPFFTSSYLTLPHVTFPPLLSSLLILLNLSKPILLKSNPLFFLILHYPYLITQPNHIYHSLSTPYLTQPTPNLTLFQAHLT